MAIIADKVIDLLKEGVGLWRTYLDKKSEHYALHLKKRRQKALKIANEMDEATREMFGWISQYLTLNDEGWKKFNEFKKKYYKLDKKFDKLS